MTTGLRASKFRLIGGSILALAGLLIALFLLPDAGQKRQQKDQALADARTSQQRQDAALKSVQAESDRLRADRQSLDDLMKNMPAEGVGKLHWKLSEKLYELAKKHEVRLVAVKYGPPTREASKGSQLESVDVEFNLTGIYLNLKSFMLGLEGSKLPFAVVAAKMEESPEGAHLTITLRAFRQATPTAAELRSGEGA
jgi:hypothetical protein